MMGQKYSSLPMQQQQQQLSWSTPHLRRRSASPNRNPKKYSNRRPRMKAKPADWSSSVIPGSINRSDRATQKVLEEGWHPLHPARMTDLEYWEYGPQEEDLHLCKDNSSAWKFKNKNPSDIRFPVGAELTAGLNPPFQGTQSHEFNPHQPVAGLTESGNLAYEIYAVRRARKQSGGTPFSSGHTTPTNASEDGDLYPTLGGDLRRTSLHVPTTPKAGENTPKAPVEETQQRHPSSGPSATFSDRFVSQQTYRRPLTSSGNLRQLPQSQAQPFLQPPVSRHHSVHATSRHVNSAKRAARSSPCSPRNRGLTTTNQGKVAKSLQRPKTAPVSAPYPRRRTLQSPVERFGGKSTYSFAHSKAFDVKDVIGDDEEIWMDIKLRGVDGNVGQVCFHPKHFLKDLRRTIQIQLRHRIDFQFFFLYSDGIKINLQQEGKLKASQFWPAIVLQPRIDESSFGKGRNRTSVSQSRSAQRALRGSSSEPLMKKRMRSPSAANKAPVRAAWGTPTTLQEYEEHLNKIGIDRQDEMVGIIGGQDAIQEHFSETSLYNRTKKTLEIYADQAAITLQSFARKQNAKKVVETRRMMHKNAIIIQSHYRGHAFRKKMDKQSKAAVVIQSLWRKELARKTVEKKIQCQNEKATCLQSWCREVLLRIALENKISAATTIQCEFRMWSVRQMLRRQERAATTIQSQIRCLLKAREFNCQRHGAVMIQAGIRQHLARKRISALRRHRCVEAYVGYVVSVVQSIFRQQQLSATRIQSKVRQQIAKREMARRKLHWFAIACGTSVVDQGLAHAVSLEAEKRKFEQEQRRKAEQKDAAIKIQCMVRRYDARQRYSTQKEFMVREVFFVHRTCVAMGGRSLLVLIRGNKKHVNCSYTDARSLSKRDLVIPFEEIVDSGSNGGTTLNRQDKIDYCLFAIAKERAEAYHQEQIEHAAATKIQCQARNKLARKTVRQKKEEQEAALHIQTAARRKHARNEFKAKMTERNQTVGGLLLGKRRYLVRVDTYFKGFIRVHLYDPYAQREVFVNIAEEAFAGTDCARFRDLARGDKLKTLSGQLLQWGLKQDAEIEAELQAQNDAAIVIESAIRRRLAMKQVGAMKLQQQEIAATQIQCTARQRKAKKVVGARRERQRGAAVVIQSSERKRQAKKRVAKVRVQHQRQTQAAVKIQSLERRRQAKRRVVTRREARRANAAVKVQALTRQYQAKARVNTRRQQNAAAIQIQSVARGRLSRKQAEDLRLELEELQNESAIALQCMFRKAQASKIVTERRKEHKEHEAAVQIQKTVRINLAKKQKEEVKRSQLEPLDFNFPPNRKYIGNYYESNWQIQYTFHEEGNPDVGGCIKLQLDDSRLMGFYGENFKDLDVETKQKMCFIHLTKWRMDQLESERTSN